VTATAPTQAQTGMIAGVVRDTAGRLIADVEVTVSPLDRRTRTDSSGQFRFTELPESSYLVRVRHLGFFPAEQRASLRTGEIVLLTFVLVDRAATLDTVHVTAQCPRFKFEGFLCRKGTGAGDYMDERAIDSSGARFPALLLQGHPGFRVVPHRGRLVVESTTGWRCVTTLVNGYPPTRANPLPNWPGDMRGLEIYERRQDVPVEYQPYSGRCSLIVYWTLVRPRKKP
jgi:carboxypeptidase family protein